MVAGPFGDVIRYSPTLNYTGPGDNYNGITFDDWYYTGLNFPRPISLWRTSYSVISLSRSYLPDEVGAVTWTAQYAPHHSVYLPVYASAPETPSPLIAGTLCKPI